MQTQGGHVIVKERTKYLDRDKLREPLCQNNLQDYDSLSIG